MKKSSILLIVLLFAAVTTVSAQLKVDASGRVAVMGSTYQDQRLTVGNATSLNSSSIGVASSPEVMNKSNIGVGGGVSANSSYSQDRNYGVLGIVSPMNNTHGRNYGVSGMIGPLGNHYGGAGVYGTNSTYYFTYPISIQGEYAGYFVGPVNVTNFLTAPAMYTSADSRLSENIVTLGGRDASGSETLKNVLNMNVVEYNMRSRLTETAPSVTDPGKEEEVRKSYEVLKSDEEAMASRRHFGVVAEELQEIYPDLVLEGQDGYLSVNYSELVPILIRSIQELKQELDEVKGGKGTARMAPQSTGMSQPTASKGNILYQNTPNPFKGYTSIRFQLADDVKDAAVCIFDLSGKLLKKVTVTSGMESVSVNGYELGEGMFLYSLVVNGQETDTKRMILSK